MINSKLPLEIICRMERGRSLIRFGPRHIFFSVRRTNSFQASPKTTVREYGTGGLQKAGLKSYYAEAVTEIDVKNLDGEGVEVLKSKYEDIEYSSDCVSF